MIMDIEEESKTKFSREVEFSFSFKSNEKIKLFCIDNSMDCVIIIK